MQVPLGRTRTAKSKIFAIPWSSRAPRPAPGDDSPARGRHPRPRPERAPARVRPRPGGPRAPAGRACRRLEASASPSARGREGGGRSSAPASTRMAPDVPRADGGAGRADPPRPGGEPPPPGREDEPGPRPVTLAGRRREASRVTRGRVDGAPSPVYLRFVFGMDPPARYGRDAHTIEPRGRPSPQPPGSGRNPNRSTTSTREAPRQGPPFSFPSPPGRDVEPG